MRLNQTYDETIHGSLHLLFFIYKSTLIIVAIFKGGYITFFIIKLLIGSILLPQIIKI